MNIAPEYPLAGALPGDRLAAIPAELIERRQWFRSKFVYIAGSKPDKRPWHPTQNRPASVTDPTTWGTFAEAHSNIGRDGTVAVGYVFSVDDPYFGVDLDRHTDDNGELTPNGRRWLELFDTYSEWSLSGRGLHIIGKGKLPRNTGKKDDVRGVEAYDHARYFAFTGARVEGTRPTIEPRQTALDAFVNEYFPQRRLESAKPINGTTENESRHDQLRSQSVKNKYVGLSPGASFAALAHIRDNELHVNGRSIPDAELWSLVNSADQKYEPPTHTLPEVVDLYSDAVQPVRPKFAVENLIPAKGIVLAWAVPNGLKTYTSASIAHQLLDDDGADTLFGHPDLQINHRWGRVLWIGTEETAGELRERGDRIVAGMGCERPTGGRLTHLWASSPQGRVTLDHLPAILKRDGPLDAVVLDSLTGLRPPEVDGRRIAWDVDNDAANRVCIQLRGLAEEFGVVFIVLHHTGRDTAKGYRGPTDWWASTDTMFGLIPREDRIEVRVEKNRHGRRIEPFLLQPTWTADAFTLAHVGAAPVVLKQSDAAVLSWLRSQHTASQVAIQEGTGLAIRTIKTSIPRLVQAQHIERCGATKEGSPVYRLKGGE